MSARNSIPLDDSASILSRDTWPGDQHILRVQAPLCAATALPGQFVHISCGPTLHMRRPISIQRVDKDNGIVELLYKVVGIGTQALSELPVGTTVSVLGPIGKPFSISPERPMGLLLGGGVGMPPMIFLAEAWKAKNGFKPLVLLGSEAPFPMSLDPQPASIKGLDQPGLAAAADLEAKGVPSRLASMADLDGAFKGYITDLARQRLQALSAKELSETQMYACGPHVMLEATAKLAREFNVPCQVSLEEYMACAVGGCAGCTVPVLENDATVMRRVCVDGPVFDANAVFP